MENSKSDSLLKRAKKVMPGGVNSPVRAFKAVGGNPPFIKSAKGPYVVDVDGNQFIDFVGSWGPMILGHADPAVIDSIQKVAVDGTSFGAPTEREVILAEMIVERVPGCEMVRLVNSGTEATMSAIRLARGITSKDKIIKFAGSYHGHGDSFLIEAGSGALTLGEPNSPGVTRATAQDTLLAEFNDIDSVAALCEKYCGEIGAIIVEPVNGNTGCIPPQDDFLQKLRDVANTYDILLVFDEVMTGFRIAQGGAAEYYSVIADIYTFGKVMGGGMPIGAYGGKREFMEQVSPVGPIYQAGTLSGNPLAVTAGIETLQKLTHDSYALLEDLGAYLETGVQNIIDTNEYPICQHRVGSMFSLFFHSGPIHNTHDVANCDVSLFTQFFHSLLQQGVYIAPSQYEAGFISTMHTKDILDVVISKIDVALKETFILRKDALESAI